MTNYDSNDRIIFGKNFRYHSTLSNAEIAQTALFSIRSRKVSGPCNITDSSHQKATSVLTLS